MGTVRLLARCEIRRRWRSTVALALLVGAIGAVVLATAAGARRSDAALERFNAFSRTSDVELSIGRDPTASELKTFRDTPGVAALALLHGFALVTQADENMALAAPEDTDMGNLVDRSRLIEGRQTDPSAPDEVTIGETLAARMHLHIGSQLAAQTYTPAQVATALAFGQPGGPRGPSLRLRIVGIVRRPLDLGVRAASGGVAVLTPAFSEKYSARIGTFTDVLRVKTVRGADDVPGVVEAARKLWGDEDTFDVQGLGIESEGARNAIDVLTISLWIFAAVSALAGLVAISIVLTRDIAKVNVDQSTLRSLGATRGQRVMAIGARAVLVAAGGAVIAVVGAAAVSPLFPVGLGRRADPDVGVHADWLILAAGIVVVGLVVLAVAILAAWRATRRLSPDRVARARRTSPIVELAARAGMRPTTINGLRMALQSGTGDAAVPVRSAFAGAAFGIAGITAVLLFGASLSHLIATPGLSGWTWDLKTEVSTIRESTCADADDHGIARTEGVVAVSAVCTKNVEIDGRPVTAWGLRRLRGVVEPTVVSGRPPREPGEIALGAVTMREAGKHIGDPVDLAVDEKRRRFRVVGQIALPQIDSPQPLADGALLTEADLAALAESGSNETHYLLVRLAPGASRAPINAKIEELDRLAIANGDSRVGNTNGPTEPVEIDRLEQINWFPATLAALLATLALLAIGHALVTSVRRRRRELALLKTMGFGRGQLSATVAWQATTLAVVGLVIGIPVGLLVGTAVWGEVADGLGISRASTIPAAALIGMGVAALVLANVIALIPARSAARTPAAVALRSE